MERQLDLSSVAARLRGRPVLACPSQFLVSRTSSRGSCLAVSTLACTPVLVCRLIIKVVSRSRQTVSTFTALLTCLAVILIVGAVYYSYSWCLFRSVLGEFPTEPVTSEAHPYPP